MIAFLHENAPFLLWNRRLDSANGLLAVGGSLSPMRLLEAYRQGIFLGLMRKTPSCGGVPIRAWCCFLPNSRFPTGCAKPCASVYEIRTDTAFEQVMRACAAPRNGQAGNSDTRRDGSLRTPRCIRWAMRIGSNRGRMDSWLAGCTALPWVECSTVNPCFSFSTDASKVALARFCCVKLNSMELSA